MLLTRVLLCCALACALPSHAQDERDGAPPDDAYSLRLSQVLAAKGGARNLALAAWLREIGGNRRAVAGMPDDDTPSQAMPEDAQSAAWRRDAARARDRDVLVDLMLANADGDIGREAAARWAAAEPDNAAPLLFQGLPADALLAAMRGRQRFDLHYLEEVRWLAGVYAANPPTAAETAPLSDDDEPLSPDAIVVNGANGISAPIAIPRFTALTSACRDAALRASATRAADCAHAADVLSGASDTLIGRLIGMALREYGATDDATRDAAREARRRTLWQLAQWRQVAEAQSDNGAAQYLRLLRDASIHTEVDLVGRVLQDAKVASEPPADWQPQPPPQRRR